MTGILFSETQRLAQAGIILVAAFIFLAIVLVVGRGVYAQLALGIPFGSKPMSNAVLVALGALLLFVLIVVFWMLATARLETTITGQGLHLRFPPFHRKEKLIPVEGVKQWKIISLNAMKDFRGWGIRYDIFKDRHGWIAGGDQALELHLEDGKIFIVTTRKPAPLSKVMEQVFGKGKR